MGGLLGRVVRPVSLMAGAGVLALVVAACGGSPSTSTSKSPFVVGFANPLTGSEATYGVSDLNAVTMAADSLNAQGGVAGHKIQIVQCDTKADPATGIACAHLFVSDKVNAVIGFFNSDISIPASGILHQAGIPMVSAASTNPQLTLQGFKNVFRICGTDNFQGQVEAEFAYKVLHVRTAVAINDEETYGQGVSQYFAQNFAKLGGTVLSSQGVNASATDFTSLLTQIKGLNPGIIQFGGFNPAAGLLVKQARSLGITAPFISDDGTIGPLFYQTGGSATVGAYLSSEPAPQDLATSKTFVSDYVKKYGNQPTEFAGYSYDAMELLGHVVQTVGSDSPAAIIRGLAAVHDYKGITGVINFDSVGNNVTPQYLIYKVQPDGSSTVDWNPNA
ncbi:MAG: branched-chain amino acid ABC transporter substrate-binding protein [Candidatus Dormibacteraeota bacterium]|jgi:branched-chain amino acid transport system substrate-binding protein|nr:branched-chain amino acid ABC transporter substrate-binding protein [Candidatus Dormibacteraeota bacterium]